MLKNIISVPFKTRDEQYKPPFKKKKAPKHTFLEHIGRAWLFTSEIKTEKYALSKALEPRALLKRRVQLCAAPPEVVTCKTAALFLRTGVAGRCLLFLRAAREGRPAGPVQLLERSKGAPPADRGRRLRQPCDVQTRTRASLKFAFAAVLFRDRLKRMAVRRSFKFCDLWGMPGLIGV